MPPSFAAAAPPPPHSSHDEPPHTQPRYVDDRHRHPAQSRRSRLRPDGDDGAAGGRGAARRASQAPRAGKRLGSARPRRSLCRRVARHHRLERRRRQRRASRPHRRRGRRRRNGDPRRRRDGVQASAPHHCGSARRAGEALQHGEGDPRPDDADRRHRLLRRRRNVRGLHCADDERELVPRLRLAAHAEHREREPSLRLEGRGVEQQRQRELHRPLRAHRIRSRASSAVSPP